MSKSKLQLKSIDQVKIRINGVNYVRQVEARLLLVHFIRQVAGLTGTHIGCDTSNCGACTIMLDGRSVKSCTFFAVQAHNREILTVEGLAKGDQLHPLQQAFWDHHAVQCGFCTPGLIMQAYQLLHENPRPTEEQVRRGIAGNLCRCTGYHNIVKAILAAADQMGGSKGKRR